MSDSFQVRIAAGPRATEEALLADLEALVAAREAGIPRRQILIVVPSHSLRIHLLARIAQRFERPVLGLACRTHRHVAVDLLERQEVAPPVNDLLLPVLAARHARREPALSGALGRLDRGYAAVGGPVRDLLDAGLEPELGEGLAEALAEEAPPGISPPEVARGLAVLAVAAGVAIELDRLGLAASAGLLRRAAERVRAGAELPGDEIDLRIHGFADATGVTTDFLEALLSRCGGTLYLDRPPDPGDRERDEPGVAFSRNFTERLLAGGTTHVLFERAAAPEIQLCRAAGAEAEARAAAGRARELIDAGVPPEEIGLVARRLEPYRFALPEQLERLGVPFSALGTAGGITATGRKLAALLDLLRLRGQTPVDRWLELDRRLVESGPAQLDWHLLYDGLLCLGAGRLAEVASVEFEPVLRGSGYPLPCRLGFRAGRSNTTGGGARVELPSRSVPAELLARARATAEELLLHLEELGRAAHVDAFEQALATLLRDGLGWEQEAEPTRETYRLLGAATRGLPPGSQLSFDEGVELLGDALERQRQPARGGIGGGVQLLDVIEARGRTFRHLSLLGLNRGVFPRPIHEDSLLGDALRKVLGRHGFGVLPDLAQKRTGFDEERFLFAQLLDAAPEITLSWQETDDEGVQLSASPLVERLRWSRRPAPADWERPPMAPHPRSRRAAAAPGLRSAGEQAILAGMFGQRRDWERSLPAALERAGRSAAAADRLTAVRSRVLAEIDPARGDTAGAAVYRRLGPYLGLVGPPLSELDPRRAESIWLTRLEGLTACPWQVFLQKTLRLEALDDPLEMLPALDGRLVGLLVHRVLERLVERQIGGGADSLEEARLRLPLAPQWPSASSLDALVERAADRLVADEGIALPGFANALAATVQGHLEVLRRLDWADGAGQPSVAVEVRGATGIVDADGRRRQLRFRADRVDRAARGLRLTDYNTGRGAVSHAVKPETLRTHLYRAVASGERLQAVAYARASGHAGDSGRYLFLHPELDLEDPARSLQVAADEADFQEAFERAARRALAAWDRGLLFPRLLRIATNREPKRCSFCAVAEACSRGDSGARLRLRDWVDDRLQGEAPDDPDQRALIELWQLGEPEGGRR